MLRRVEIGPAGPLPETLGPYELLGRLGFGGMGIVLDAMSPWGERVALKLTRLFLDRDQAEHIALRFHREARLLAQLDHPGIVPLRDAGIVDDLAYLALTRIEGASLRAIRRLGPLQLDVVARVGIRLARTLAHVHASGVVHRDIKPGNVLIDATGRPMLIDFGIATFNGATRITNRHDVLGTLGYIAPEVVDGETGGPLSDQYSLGRVLHTLAASTALSTASEDSRVGRILAGLEVDWSAFPTRGRWTSLQIVIQRMVADDPSERYPTLDRCADALTAVTALDHHRAATADQQLVMLARQSMEGGGMMPLGLDRSSLETTKERERVLHRL